MTKTHGTVKEFSSCTLVMKVYRNAKTCTCTSKLTVCEERLELLPSHIMLAIP